MAFFTTWPPQTRSRNCTHSSGRLAAGPLNFGDLPSSVDCRTLGPGCAMPCHMARPLRIQAAGLTYHVTARGTGRMTIYADDADRRQFLSVLGEVAESEDLACHAYCLMPNHYHLVVTTAHPNLSRAFKQVNGGYAQWWNRRHERVGHVFQGRFWSQVVQQDAYFTTVCRYVVLNPVRAGLFASPGDWPWSSYRATVGTVEAPSFLRLAPLLAQFHPSDAVCAAQRFARYVGAVEPGTQTLPSMPLLGDEVFVRSFRPWLERAGPEVPKRMRQIRPSLDAIFAGARSRTERVERMVAARRERYTVAELARHLGMHPSTISKALANWRRVRS